MVICILILILLSACTGERSAVKNENAVKQNEFLYMEEVYARAKNSFSSGNWKDAIRWYDRLNEDYPHNPYKAESLFIKGYIYKDYTDDIKQAEICFKELLDKYPASEFASSAKFELEHLNDPGFMPVFEK
ncbi:MAG TPA: hypothetical protein PLK90_08135 [Clostridiales bacterium]|nr:hypothetical protein [Clostridiales bacterium]HQP70352.1 hypothetical protein [Clostridiales bacterium]